MSDSWNYKPLSTYCIWLNLLLKNLKECATFFKTLGNDELTDNFDLMELGLRRYLGVKIPSAMLIFKDQFKKTFPNHTGDLPPAHVIRDTLAQREWEHFFGKEAYFVSFQVNPHRYVLSSSSSITR